MGYRVGIQNRRKDGTVVWRLTWEEYKGNVRSQRHVPKREWPGLGFTAEMSVAEAKAKAKQLNSLTRIRQQEARRNRIQARLQQEELEESAFLPRLFVEKFETEVVPRKRINPVFWRAAKRVIRDVKMEPSDWNDYPEAFYDYFRKRSLSLDYTKKVLRALNFWGLFISKKTAKAFLPIPYPIGFNRERINDAYKRRTRGGRKAAPLSPGELEAAKHRLREDHYHWLLISVWFGLRPYEVNNLKEPAGALWSIDRTDKRFPILRIYQSKLLELPDEERWKLIPVVCPEQRQALSIIEVGKFTMPSVRIMQTHVKPNSKRYSGRKGFTSLMRGLGYDRETYSAWLGHRSVKTTEEFYEDRTKVRFRAPRKAA